jgi:hypothetical protein
MSLDFFFGRIIALCQAHNRKSSSRHQW